MQTKFEIFDVINSFKPQKYLEVGIFRCRTFFNINCGFRLGVDPAPQISIIDLSIRQVMDLDNNQHTVILPEKSDDFFKRDIKHKFDVIFIDGFHEYKQVRKDIESSLKLLSENGVIVLHDTMPGSAVATCEYTQGIDSGEWNGDVWKVLVDLEALQADYFTYNVPNGLTVIKNKVKFLESTVEAVKALNFDYFDTHRDILRLKEFKAN